MLELERALGRVLASKGAPPDIALETPRRWIRFLEGFLGAQPEEKFTTFENDRYNEMVVAEKIRFVSLCEHHLLPFYGYGTIAYIPQRRILGLSKLARILGYHARGLQLQERLTNQVADTLAEVVEPLGVAVRLEGIHACIILRGVEQESMVVTTTALRGCFLGDTLAHTEFITLCGRRTAT
mgnify:FL=1